MDASGIDRIRHAAMLWSNSLSLARALGETVKLNTAGFVIVNNHENIVGSDVCQLCRWRALRQAAMVSRGIGK